MRKKDFINYKLWWWCFCWWHEFNLKLTFLFSSPIRPTNFLDWDLDGTKTSNDIGWGFNLNLILSHSWLWNCTHTNFILHEEEHNLMMRRDQDQVLQIISSATSSVFVSVCSRFGDFGYQEPPRNLGEGGSWGKNGPNDDELKNYEKGIRSSALWGWFW